jgi:excisionase family DNA binding protein
MTMLTLGKAAKLAGVGKSTLARAIAAGRLSATKTEAGTYEIDTAELARVYPLVAHGDAAGATGAAARPTARQAALGGDQRGTGGRGGRVAPSRDPAA